MDVSVHLHAPAGLPMVRDTRYPLERRMSGTQNRTGRWRREEIPAKIFGNLRKPFGPITAIETSEGQ